MQSGLSFLWGDKNLRLLFGPTGEDLVCAVYQGQEPTNQGCCLCKLVGWPSTVFYALSLYSSLRQR